MGNTEVYRGSQNMAVEHPQKMDAFRGTSVNDRHIAMSDCQILMTWFYNQSVHNYPTHKLPSSFHANINVLGWSVASIPCSSLE